MKRKWKQRWENRWIVVVLFFLESPEEKWSGLKRKKGTILSPHTSSISPPLPFLSLHTNTVSQLWQEASSSNQKAEREGFGRADIAEWRSRRGRTKMRKEEERKGIRREIPWLRQTGSRKKTKSGFLEEPEPSKNIPQWSIKTHHISL